MIERPNNDKRQVHSRFLTLGGSIIPCLFIFFFFVISFQIKIISYTRTYSCLLIAHSMIFLSSRIVSICIFITSKYSIVSHSVMDFILFFYVFEIEIENAFRRIVKSKKNEREIYICIYVYVLHLDTCEDTRLTSRPNIHTIFEIHVCSFCLFFFSFFLRFHLSKTNR